MADTISAEARSRNMAAIRSRDTVPEVYIRKLLFAKGYRYRKNTSSVPGHPDLYLAKYGTVVFVHGCFWHRHKNCKYAYTPKSRVEFWEAKFNRNIERDQRVKEEVLNKGLKYLAIWECTIRKMRKSETEESSVMQKIVSFLDSSEVYLEI